MAANAYIIVVGWLISFLVIVGVSLAGAPRPESELQGACLFARQLPVAFRPVVSGADSLGRRPARDDGSAGGDLLVILHLELRSSAKCF